MSCGDDDDDEESLAGDEEEDPVFALRRGSDPRVATCRGKLQTRRSKLNQEINRELRLRAGAENLFRATTNRKLKETVALELSFVNSNLQLLKEQLAELNSSVELYQGDSSEPVIPMIPLGLKETKEIDFREPFKDFILEHYSEDGSQYDEAITEFMDLRQAMRTPQRDSTGISLLFQYYNHLYFVERRFFPPDRSLGIYFEWYDSLTGVPSCQRTVAFEKACVLFNAAGLYTQMGAREDRATARGLDRAVDTFLRAAGALAYLLDNFANPPSVDLAPPTLTILIALMLAQARECLFEKLELQSKDKRDIDVCFDLAQEAAQVVEVYREAHSLMSEVVDFLPSSWPSLVQVKVEHYSGISRQRTSEALYLAAGPEDSTPTNDDAREMSQETAAKLKRMKTHCEANMVETASSHQQYALLGAAQLRSAIGHHEEALRLQRMCRELRHKRCLAQVLTRAAKQASTKYLAGRGSETLSDLIDPPCLPGSTKFQLSLTMPDLGQQRVEDLFRRLGPLAVFSAKQHWSAPRSVRLHHQHDQRRTQCSLCTETAQGQGSESGYGFTISTDCPVVVTSVQTNSLAHFGGIKEGDFIVGIGDADVKWATHDQVVALIRQSEDILRLKVVTPMDSNYLRASRTPSKSSKKNAEFPNAQKAEERRPRPAGGPSSSSSSSSSSPPTSTATATSTAAAAQQKKHSWNPFRKNRERETAFNMILR